MMLNVGSEKGFYFTNPQDYLDGKTNDLNETTYTIFGVQTYAEIFRSEYSAYFFDGDGISMAANEFANIIEKELGEFDFPFYVKKLKPHLATNQYRIQDLRLLEKLEHENSWRPSDWIRDTSKPLDASLSYPLKEGAPEPVKFIVANAFKKEAHPIVNRKDLPEYLIVGVKFSNHGWVDKADEKSVCAFYEKLEALMHKTFGENAKVWSHTDTSKTSKIINGSAIKSVKDINGKDCTVGDTVYYAAHCGDLRIGKITKFTDISIFIDGICYGKANSFGILKA